VGADLRGANLNGCNLDGVDLTGTKLQYCRGNRKQVKSSHCDMFDVVYTKDMLFLGCAGYTIDEWRTLTYQDIKDAPTGKWPDEAWGIWEKWKPIIFQIIEMSPGE